MIGKTSRIGPTSNPASVGEEADRGTHTEDRKCYNRKRPRRMDEGDAIQDEEKHKLSSLIWRTKKKEWHAPILFPTLFI
jgi:hypothetical protein